MRTEEPMVSRADVVIVTALTMEYEAALEVEEGSIPGNKWRELRNPFTGQPLAFRYFKKPDGRILHFALAHAGAMGTSNTAATLAVLCDRLQPLCLAMSGVCAGQPKKTALGDVIASERLDILDGGKELPEGRFQSDPSPYCLPLDWKTDLERFGFERRFIGHQWFLNRPVPIEWQENIVLAWINANKPPTGDEHPVFSCEQYDKVIRALIDNGYIRSRKQSAGKNPFVLTAMGVTRTRALPQVMSDGSVPDLSPVGSLLPFALHVAPIVSGNRVVENEAIWGFISNHQRKSLGLEMEAAAVGRVATMAMSRPTALVMKGVMDFADHGRDDHFKKFSARASAECLVSFLREKLIPKHPAHGAVDGVSINTPQTTTEILVQNSIVELVTELSRSWGVDEGRLRITPLLRSLLELRTASDEATLKKARAKLRPYYGSSVRERYPETYRLLKARQQELGEDIRSLLDVFD